MKYTYKIINTEIKELGDIKIFENKISDMLNNGWNLSGGITVLPINTPSKILHYGQGVSIIRYLYSQALQKLDKSD